MQIAHQPASNGDKGPHDKATSVLARLLSTPSPVPRTVELRRRKVLFFQGDVSDAAYYVCKGKLKLTVNSANGREATIALLAEGDFVGEECVQATKVGRLATATAMTQCVLLKIERREMLHLLSAEESFSKLFISCLLARNIRLQEDLIDQLFNSTEKRLARALLLLAQFGKDGPPETVLPKISQEMLAEMIGTTRSRVSFFMNRFRRMGFIEYKNKLRVNISLMNVFLHDDASERSSKEGSLHESLVAS